MRRRGSRRLERAIRDLINRDGGHCSVCRDPFAHGADLAYGSTQERAIAVVGECCIKKLTRMVGVGVYLLPADSLQSELGRRPAGRILEHWK